MWTRVMGVWPVQAGGSSSDCAHSVATDASGATLVAGYFQSTATFGTTELTSAGSSDVFVLRMRDGRVEWVVQAGGEDFDEASGIISDGAGAPW